MGGILFRLRYKYIYDFILCQEVNENKYYKKFNAFVHVTPYLIIEGCA